MSGKTGWRLDVPKLAGVVDAVRQREGLTQRGLARELGTSPSTVTRLLQGRRPDADALTTILVWLKADLKDYAKQREGTSEQVSS